MADAFFQNGLIFMPIGIEEFSGTLNMNLKTVFKNSKWRTQYGKWICKQLLNFHETWYGRSFWNRFRNQFLIILHGRYNMIDLIYNKPRMKDKHFFSPFLSSPGIANVEVVRNYSLFLFIPLFTKIFFIF